MANTLKFFIVGDSKDGEAALDRVDSKVQSATDNFVKMGVAAAAATAALSIKEATEFESKMAEVSTLLDDTSGLEGMEQAIKDLAIEYGQFPDDQVESIYSIISAGAEDAAEAVQTLEAANRLAIGGVTDVAIAADGLTSVLNAYGEEAGTATNVSDAMFVAMKAGKTTIGELSNSIGNVAPIAAEAGVGLDELLAATAALTKTGATTSVSMGGLRQVVASVLKPTAEAAKEAEKLGLEFNSAALESKGLQGFLEDLTAKTGGNKDSLTQLFGSVEALGPIFALTGSQSQAFSDIMEDMNNKAGATDIAFGKIEETGAQAFKRIQAAGNVLAIEIGNQLLPAVADLANFFIGPTTEGINKVEEAFFLLRTAAFSVLGGVSNAILAMISPLASAQNLLNDFFGIEARDSAFISLEADLKMFSAAMEEGAVETFQARDAAVLHNIELRKQSDLLRGITEDTLVKKEVEAVARVEKEEAEAVARVEKEEAEAVARAEKEEAEIVHQIKLTKIEKKEQEKRKRQEEETRQTRVDGANQLINDTTAVLLAGNKTQFEAGKNLASAQALTETYAGAQKAFSSLASIPIIGPALGTTAAVAATAAGLLRVKNIQGQTYSQAHGGLDEVQSDQTFFLKKGEMVLDPGTSEGVRNAAKGLGGGGRSVIIENLQLIIQGITGAGGNINWDKTAEQEILPAINRLFRRSIFFEGVAYDG